MKRGPDASKIAGSPLLQRARQTKVFTLPVGVEPAGDLCRQPINRPHFQYCDPCYQLCIQCDTVHQDLGVHRCCAHSCCKCGAHLFWNGWQEWRDALAKR